MGKNGKRYWGKKGAGILFTDGTHILLLRRAGNSDNKGTWGLPGGKLKKGESFSSGARRESQEETGIRPPGDLFDRFEDRDGHHTFVVFLFKVKEPFEVYLSKEHDKSKWAKIDDLSSFKLHPRLEKNIDRYLKAIKNKFKSISFAEWLFTQ